MLAHVSGLDGAGHTYGLRHSEIERKLLDTEKIMQTIIEKMDNNTTLLVWGDHGMTIDGNHGGSELLEMRTTLFAYQKTPFPMYEHYDKGALRKYFRNIDKTVKHLDLAPILSMLLDVPFPFSSLGFMHPIFA